MCKVGRVVMLPIHTPPCRSDYLSRFVPPPSPNTPSCVGALVERMACRVLLFFVRHAALLRPLSQAGKLLVGAVRVIASMRRECRVLLFLVRRIALLRHQTHTGKLLVGTSCRWICTVTRCTLTLSAQVAKDLAELQAAVGPLCMIVV